MSTNKKKSHTLRCNVLMFGRNEAKKERKPQLKINWSEKVCENIPTQSIGPDALCFRLNMSDNWLWSHLNDLNGRILTVWCARNHTCTPKPRVHPSPGRCWPFRRNLIKQSDIKWLNKILLYQVGIWASSENESAGGKSNQSHEKRATAPPAAAATKNTHCIHIFNILLGILAFVDTTQLVDLTANHFDLCTVFFTSPLQLLLFWALICYNFFYSAEICWACAP